jgi:membrane-associated phospholipid phosphatase
MPRGSLVALQLAAAVGWAACADRACAAESPQRLRWADDWRRVGALEYTVTLTFGAGGFMLQQLDRADEARWVRPVLMDAWMRDELRLSSASSRRSAARWSDVLIWVLTVPPIVIDPLFVAWIGDSNPDVAWQMTVLNAQSHAISNFVTHATKRLADRARPYVQTCNDLEDRDPNCGSDADYEAFFSGHSSTAATSAGLTCAHHLHVPLYGGGFLDAAACASAIGLSTTVGVLRVAADKHWTTDVVTGQIAGYLAGFAIPTLGYYRGIVAEAGGEEPAARIAWTPVVTSTDITLQAFGWF